MQRNYFLIWISKILPTYCVVLLLCTVLQVYSFKITISRHTFLVLWLHQILTIFDHIWPSTLSCCSIFLPSLCSNVFSFKQGLQVRHAFFYGPSLACFIIIKCWALIANWYLTFKASTLYVRKTQTTHIFTAAALTSIISSPRHHFEHVTYTCSSTHTLWGKLLAKYIIIIYALRSAHGKYGIWIKAIPRAKFSAKPGGKNEWAIPDWNSHSKLIQTPIFSCT